MAIHQCPLCELRFVSSSEVEWHLIEDHGSRRVGPRPTASTTTSAHGPPRTRGS